MTLAIHALLAVWPDLAKFCHFGQILTFIGNFRYGLISIWQAFVETLAIFELLVKFLLLLMANDWKIIYWTIKSVQDTDKISNEFSSIQVTLYISAFNHQTWIGNTHWWPIVLVPTYGYICTIGTRYIIGLSIIWQLFKNQLQTFWTCRLVSVKQE